MRLGIFQYDIHPDPEVNLKHIDTQVRTMENHGIDLLVLPEVCLTGFGGGKTIRGFEEDSEPINHLKSLSQIIPIIGSFRILENSKVYNRALFFDKQDIQMRYDKRILFRHWQEHHRFHPGDRPESFVHKGWQVAPFICYELRFPEIFRRQLDAELMIVVANWPRCRREHWLTLLRARAIENQAYVAGINRLGKVGAEEFTGDSVVFGPRGEAVLDMGSQEGCAWADLDLANLREYRKTFPILRDAQT